MGGCFYLSRFVIGVGKLYSCTHTWQSWVKIKHSILSTLPLSNCCMYSAELLLKVGIEGEIFVVKIICHPAVLQCSVYSVYAYLNFSHIFYLNFPYAPHTEVSGIHGSTQCGWVPPRGGRTQLNFTSWGHTNWSWILQGRKLSMTCPSLESLIWKLVPHLSKSRELVCWDTKNQSVWPQPF